ncbi:hypothetical protein AXF42_Ash012513 [Apostasia shenzhenica]|uniref:Uncharacterized protein n=1 Tax=Apostasia shenzhenica TaxID=1088818 RepID=A0A2I0AR03_9ASPA|nr:hypothetical protein AXF42_Ash012513 [Apostasia shenzhenica]
MAWFLGGRRGPPWRQGWRSRALSSFSLPPPPLLAVFAIVLLLLSLSSFNGYRERVVRAEVGLRLLLLLVPLLLVVAARTSMFAEGRFVGFRVARPPEQEDFRRAGSSPWGMAALVALLLILVSFQSSVHSQWLRPIWRRY